MVARIFSITLRPGSVNPARYSSTEPFARRFPADLFVDGFRSIARSYNHFPDARPLRLTQRPTAALKCLARVKSPAPTSHLEVGHEADAFPFRGVRSPVADFVQFHTLHACASVGQHPDTFAVPRLRGRRRSQARRLPPD